MPKNDCICYKYEQKESDGSISRGRWHNNSCPKHGHQ